MVIAKAGLTGSCHRYQCHDAKSVPVSYIHRFVEAVQDSKAGYASADAVMIDSGLNGTFLRHLQFVSDNVKERAESLAANSLLRCV